jgi:hypothetical protein
MSKPDRQEFSTSSNYFTTLIIVTNKNERKFIFAYSDRSDWLSEYTLDLDCAFLALPHWFRCIGSPSNRQSRSTYSPARTLLNSTRHHQPRRPGIAGLIGGRFVILASLAFLGLAPLLILILIPRRISNLPHLTA